MADVAEKEDVPQDADRSVEAGRCAELDRQEQYVVRLWWQRLTLGDGQARSRELPPPWPRGVRAILRRCESPDAAVLTEGFRKLWQMLHKANAEEASGSQPHRDIQAWACAALVAAELRDEQPGVSPARAFGSQRKETGKPRVSELRFQQLQQSHSPEELVRRLRRAIAMAGQKDVSVVHLVDDVLLWCRENTARDLPRPRRVEDRIAFRWANDYFTTLARYQRND